MAQQLRSRPACRWPVLLAWLLSQSLLGGCEGCEPGMPDGGLDGAPGLDAALDGGVDAGVDGGLWDAGSDASPIFDAGADGGFDAGFDAGLCVCEMPLECHICSVDTGCVDINAPDGTLCSTGRCLDGECVAGGVCGDGFREPGPTPPREACDDGNTDDSDACDSGCEPLVLVIASEAGEEAVPVLVSVAVDDGGELLFVWTETVGEELYLRARRTSAAGVASGAAFDLGGDLGRGWDPHASVVGLASGWVVVWAERGGDASEAGIRSSLVSSSGMAATPRQVNQYELGRQASPSAARTSGGFIVAWADESGTMTLPGESRLRQRSFDFTGRALSDESALSPDGTSAREVSLASDGATALAVWTQDTIVPFARSTVVGRRLGASPDADPFTISDIDGAQPAAAFLDGGDIAVAWVGRSADPRGDIRARVVRGVGDPLAGTSVTALTSTLVAEVAPRVLPLPGGYLVTYEDGGTRRGVGVVEAGPPPLAAEYPNLISYLTEGLQGDVTLLRTAEGSWFAWSAAGALGVSGAHRSFLAYLLPPD